MFCSVVAFDFILPIFHFPIDLAVCVLGFFLSMNATRILQSKCWTKRKKRKWIQQQNKTHNNITYPKPKNWKGFNFLVKIFPVFFDDGVFFQSHTCIHARRCYMHTTYQCTNQYTAMVCNERHIIRPAVYRLLSQSKEQNSVLLENGMKLK